MKYTDVMNLVLNHPYNLQDWSYNDKKGIFTFKDDVNLTIRRVDNDSSNDSFREPWVKIFPDDLAYRIYYEIYYGASFIKEFMLVDVDGCRSQMPIPVNPTSNEVSTEMYNLAKAVDFQETLDYYINKANFNIVD